MAIIRCSYHGKPRGRKYIYVTSVKPVGYPVTAAICGMEDCGQPGLVWLTDDEYHAYEDGQRIFDIYTNAARIKVE